MSGVDPARLVLISCTTPGRPEGCSSGTGYFVTGNIVLTASHVVPDGATGIRVRLEGSKSWQTEGAVLWRDQQLDAALLSVSPGVPGLGAVEFLKAPAAVDMSWTSVAYPTAATNDDTADRKTLGLDGKLYWLGGGGQGSRELDLVVSGSPPTKGWAGASGAPIFVGDCLAGIIKSELSGGGRFNGVPIDLLLADPDFRLALAPQWLELPSDRFWALVLQSEKSSVDLATGVAAAISRINADGEGKADAMAIRPEPLVVSITDALQSAERWYELVRALCKAPIMVCDGSGFEPGVMLALGVRAVVRRGVTVTSVAGKIDETHLAQLPFNIQETQFVGYDDEREANDNKNPIYLLQNSISTGIEELSSYKNYLDLPVYDAVRNIPPSFAKANLKKTTLILCSFQPNYRRTGRLISSVLLEKKSQHKIIRMLDVPSPRLVGQSLYERIRWTPICIVDWTNWRANVFFEFGVRLACSSLGAVCLIDSPSSSETGLVQYELLRQLFRPSRYASDKRNSIVDALNEQYDFAKEQSRNVARDAVPYDATHRMIVQVFDWRQEDIVRRPDRLLRSIAELEIGSDPQKSGESLVLFGTNPEFAQVLQAGVQERWIAAWYYLKNRHPANGADEQLSREMLDLAETVLQVVPKESKDEKLTSLRNELVADIKGLSTHRRSMASRADIVQLKTEAKNRRDIGSYEEAADRLKIAIGLASKELSAMELASQSPNELANQKLEINQTYAASELADSYGLLGGIFRRWALEPGRSEADRSKYLLESIRAYDKSWHFESGHYGVTSSYGMLNRLISRLLSKPEALAPGIVDFGEGIDPVDVGKELDESIKRIDLKQPVERRDYWAAADAALIRLLLEKDKSAASAYGPFLSKSPPVHAFSSVLDVLKSLARTELPVAKALNEAVIHLESQIPKV